MDERIYIVIFEVISMNKVLILSDSHGLTNEILKIKNRHQLKYVIHCGDSELDIDDPVLQDVINVSGNCDFDARLPEMQTLQVGELTFLVTHGHLYSVGTNLLNLSYLASEKNADIVCFGHTHIAGAKKIENHLFVNPGSIRLPRDDKGKTYAIIEWNNLENVFVKFYMLTGELIDDLTYRTSLKIQ